MKSHGAKRTSTSMRHATGFMSTGPSTTLADLFTLLFAANPFSAARASLWRWSSDEFEDGLAHGGQCRLKPFKTAVAKDLSLIVLPISIPARRSPPGLLNTTTAFVSRPT